MYVVSVSGLVVGSLLYRLWGGRVEWVVKCIVWTLDNPWLYFWSKIWNLNFGCFALGFGQTEYFYEQCYENVSPLISSPLIFPLLRSDVMAKFRFPSLLHKDRDTKRGDILFDSTIAYTLDIFFIHLALPFRVPDI